MAYTPIPQGTPDWDVPVNAAFVDQDTRIDANTATNVTQTANIATNTANITALQTLTNTLDWQASDHNVKGWTQDPATVGNLGAGSANGVLYLAKILLRIPATVSVISYTVQTAGTSMTAGQNFVGLYSSTGTLIATSADQSTAFTTIGTKTPSIGSQALAAGGYYVAILSNSTGTVPQFLRGNGTSGSALNLNLPLSSGRSLNFTGPFTTLPASVTLGSGNAEASLRWSALN